MHASPATIAGRTPILGVMSPVSGATTSGAMVHGMVRPPAFSAEAP